MAAWGSESAERERGEEVTGKGKIWTRGEVTIQIPAPDICSGYGLFAPPFDGQPQQRRGPQLIAG